MSDANDLKYAARLIKIKDMSKKEWKAYKNKLKSKVKSSNKEKANKAAAKLMKMKQARKQYKETKKEKSKLPQYTGSKLKFIVDTVAPVIGKFSKEKFNKVNSHINTLRNPFQGYTTEKYINDTRHFANHKAKLKDAGMYMDRYNSIVADAIKQQTEKMMKFKQDQEEFFKQRKAAHDYQLHGNVIAKTNEFNEKIDLSGNVMSENSYILREINDKRIRENEVNYDVDPKIYLHRFMINDLSRESILQEMDKLKGDDYDIGPYRDRASKRTNKESRDMVDRENLTLLTHPEFIQLKDQEHINLFNKISKIMNGVSEFAPLLIKWVVFQKLWTKLEN